MRERGLKTNLCGKSLCPGICTRVCHCETGLARGRQLLAMQRNKREMLRRKASPQPQPTSTDQRSTAPQSEPRAASLHPCPTHYFDQQPPPCSGTIHALTSTVILTLLAVFMAVVITLASLINGTSVVGHYDIPEWANQGHSWWER